MQSARANQLEIVAKTKWCHKKIYHISPSSSCTISADKGETTATAAAKAEANVKLTNQLLESWEIQQSYQEAQRLLMLVSYFSTLTFYPGDTRFFWLKIFLIFVFSWAKKSKKPINSMRISLILLLDFFFFPQDSHCLRLRSMLCFDNDTLKDEHTTKSQLLPFKANTQDIWCLNSGGETTTCHCTAIVGGLYNQTQTQPEFGAQGREELGLAPVSKHTASNNLSNICTPCGNLVHHFLEDVITCLLEQISLAV